MSIGAYAIASTAIASFGDDPVEAPPPVVKTCTRVVATDEGGRYLVSVEVVTRLAGTINVELGGLMGGVDIFGAITAAGVYSEVVTATADNAELTIIGDEDFLGTVDNVSVKRLIWLDRGVVKGSFQLDPQPEPDTPSKVTVTYTVPSDTSPNWESATASYTLPEATLEEIPLVETQVAMPGTYREEEALIKAQARALRMKNRVRATWITTDSGIAMQRGLVVQVKLPYRGIDITVKLDTVAMIGYGRYRVSGWRYDATHYPADAPAPAGIGTVPVGFITVLKAGSSVPSGWAAYSAANGKYIRVADASSTSFEVGDTGGSATYAGFSGDTTEDGAHNGSTGESFETESYTGYSGTGDGYVYEPDTALVGGHDHTYSTGTITPDLKRRDVVLIEKTGSAGATLPEAAMVFGLPGLTLAEITRHTSYKGRLLKAAASAASGGSTTQFVTINTGYTDNTHDHHSRTFVTNGYPDDIGFTGGRYDVGTGGSNHRHAITLAIQAAPKRYLAALYTGTDAYNVIPGMWGFWAGSLVSLPTDWYLCDGLNGTPDLKRFFIEIADIGKEGPTDDINLLAIEGITATDAGHDHESNYTTASTHDTSTMRHKNTVTHTHYVSEIVSWTPPYYVLAAIMYNP